MGPGRKKGRKNGVKTRRTQRKVSVGRYGAETPRGVRDTDAVGLLTSGTSGQGAAGSHSRQTGNPSETCCHLRSTHLRKQTRCLTLLSTPSEMYVCTSTSHVCFLNLPVSSHDETLPVRRLLPPVGGLLLAQRKLQHFIHMTAETRGQACSPTLAVCQSLNRSVSLSVPLSVSLYLYQSVSLSICLSVCPYACLSLCLPVYFFFRHFLLFLSLLGTMDIQNLIVLPSPCLSVRLSVCLWSSLSVATLQLM